MEKTVWGVLIQKPLGTQGKRKTTTPTAPKNQNEVVLIQKHRNLRHPQGFLGGGIGCEVGSLLSEKIR